MTRFVIKIMMTIKITIKVFQQCNFKPHYLKMHSFSLFHVYIAFLFKTQVLRRVSQQIDKYLINLLLHLSHIHHKLAVSILDLKP